MSRCTHNDHPDLKSCKNEGVKDGYCIEHGCCLCGGVMLADTEDWPVYLCFSCCMSITGDEGTGRYSPDDAPNLERVVRAAYEAGRRSVIGHCDDIEDEERPV